MPNILENGSSPCKENRQVQNEGNSQALLKSANTDLVQDSHEVSGTLQSGEQKLFKIFIFINFFINHACHNMD